MSVAVVPIGAKHVLQSAGSNHKELRIDALYQPALNETH
jgi:hypothetical protein